MFRTNKIIVFLTLISFYSVIKSEALEKNVVNFDSVINQLPKDKRVNKSDLNIFDEQILKNQITIVKAYTTWCRYCTYLIPVYKRTAAEFRQIKIGDQNIDINYWEFDADKFKSIKNKYGVTSYPRVLYFVNGKLVGNTQRPETSQELKNNITSIVTNHYSSINKNKLLATTRHKNFRKIKRK